MASRDRVILTTPIAQKTWKGWRIDQIIHFDMTTRRIEGSISFYDSAGVFISSQPFVANVSLAARNAIATACENDIIAQAPALAGTASVEVVNDINDPVVNP